MIEYKQKGELLELNLLKCLRTDYFHNDCQECMQICPKEALFFDRSKLSVDFGQCTNCGVCLGVCPTEALSLDFFDPNEYILQQNEPEVVLSCKKDIPCLSALDSEHLATLLLRKERVACDLSHCEGCELNPEDKTLASIRKRMEEAQRFIQEMGLDKKLEEASFEENRRGFFKALFQSAKQLGQESLKAQTQAIDRVPTKQIFLKNSLKSQISQIPNTTLTTNYSFLANKAIDEQCTNCGDCVQFCPTDALFFAKDGTAIWFIAGRCIDCDICNDICKPRSISDKEQIDLVTWCFDRGEELIEHQFEMCQECRTPFPYKGGEMVCERCKSFVQDFGDIFKLASEED